jgi:type I restriction enzyme S subunit
VLSIIDLLPSHTGWTKLPLGRIAPRVKEIGQPELEPLSVFLDQGVVPRSSRSDNHNELGEDLAKYLVVRPGDIVFNKLRTWQGGLGVSKHLGIVSPAYYVCRPKSEVDGTYLHYLLRSAPYLQELTRISKWMPPSQFDISWDQLRLVDILLPDLSTQVNIAKELERQTEVIENQKQLLSLLIEKRTSVITEFLFGGNSK